MAWIDNKTALFIGGSDNSSANTICISNMAKEMVSRGYRVFIVSAGKEYVRKPNDLNGIEVWQVPDSFYTSFARYSKTHPSLFNKTLCQIIQIFRHILLLPFYPITSLSRTRKVLNRSKELVEKNDIHLIIATFNSYENIYSGLMIKKMYGDRVRVVSYHLDLRTVTINNSSIIRRYVYTHSCSSIVKECHIVDKLLIPYSGRQDIENIRDIETDKIYYVGFPVCIVQTDGDKCELPFEKEAINISYIGTLSSNNRDPRKILFLLEQISKLISRRILVHIWGNIGDIKDVLDSSPVVRYHGIINNNYVRYVQDHSDFLLNIGNSLAYSMLPSKIFGMFATGKPIINIITNPQDTTIPYFNIYSNSINIKEYDESSIDVHQIAEEINAALGKPLRSIDGLFEDFKPDTICNILVH